MLVVTRTALAGSPQGSTLRVGKVATMTETEVALDRAKFDLIMVGAAVPDDGHESGGIVEFTVKELLVDLKVAVEKVGDSTKADIAAAEARLLQRITPLESKVDGLRLDRAKLLGICIGAGLASGGIAGLIARAFA